MRTALPCTLLTFLLLLAVLVPGASASHQPDDPAIFMAPEPLYGIKHDPWSGGTWVAGPGLFFRGDGGGVSHVGIREGLPINTVYDFDPTPTSLWVQTELGPAVMDKADGSFRTVTTEDGNRFFHLGRKVFAEDDVAWVGTDSEGLFKVDAASLVATPVVNPINGSRFEHQIMDVVEDGSLLYISATGYGLVEWDRSTGDARHFDVAFLEESPRYGRLLVTPSKLWVGTSGDGVVVIDRVTGETSEYVGPFTVNSRSVFNLDNLGFEYWFATEAGASRYDARADSWQYWQGHEMPWGNANDIEVIDGEVYAATNNGHVIRFDRASGAWADAHWWAGDKVLPYNTVFSCATDGDLLIGTGGGGALWHRESSSSWERIGYGADPAERPLDITLWDVDVSSGSAWFASHKGISVLDRQSGSWDHARTDGRPVGHIVDNPVRDIAVDGDEVWAATASHKIVRGPERGEEQPGNLAHWRVGESAPTRYDSSDGLSGDSVLSVDAAAGRVWIGLEKEGVDVMDAETRAVQHVWPTDGSSVRVDTIVARSDAVWVGGSAGLHRIDPETLEVTKVTAFPGMAAYSLLWDDGQLWVGAIYGGVHRYDPLTDTLDSFTTGMFADVSGLCLVRDGDILYVGTQWGVDRLDIERGRWLPKVGAGDASSVRPTIQIAQPAADTAYAPGDTVRLRGTAQVPEGAWVEVGVAGEWIRATGTNSWNAGFPVDASFSGSLTLAARVFDGQRTLAQDAVRLMVRGAGEAADIDFSHEQVLLAEVGSTIPFLVEYEPQDADLTGWVELRLPSSTEAVTVPLEVTASGVLSGSSPVLEDVGEASYVVRLQWEDGQARLPDLYGGSTAYKVTIQEAAGKPIGFLTRVRCDAGIAPGSSGEVTFGVQNTGTRAGRMEVDFAGPASAWITEVPEPFDLPPSQTHFVRVPVTVPEGTPYGPHDLAIGAGPVERTQGSVHLFTCGLVVDEAEGTQSGSGDGVSGNGTEGVSGRGVPHPGVLLALVALAVAWVRRR